MGRTIPKIAPSPEGLDPSNTWFRGPIQVYFSIGISIGSAVCGAHERDQQTDRQTIAISFQFSNH